MLRVQSQWFQKVARFDNEIRQRFGATLVAALAGQLSRWAQNAESRLALILILDQFTRNAFRGQAASFAGDVQALALALRPRSIAMTGRAELTAHDMSSNLSTVRPLGSYVLKLTGGETLTFALSTLAGSLQLSGTGSMVAGNLRFRGKAEPEDGMEAQLSNLLNLIGSRQGKQAIISFG